MDSESERRTRKDRIDPKLRSSGWRVTAFDPAHDLGSQHQCAIEEYETDNGPADYGLCVDRFCWALSKRRNSPSGTKKERPLAEEHFAEFEKSYGEDPNGKSKRRDTGADGRFRKFHISEIKERDYKLDITWLKDESLEDADELPEPQDLAAEAIIELEAVVDDLREMLTLLEQSASEAPV